MLENSNVNEVAEIRLFDQRQAGEDFKFKKLR